MRQYDQVEKHVLLHSGRAGAVEKHLRLPTDQEHMRTFSTSSEENDGLELSAVAEKNGHCGKFHVLGLASA